VVTLFFRSDGKLLPHVEPAPPLAALPLGAWLDWQPRAGRRLFRGCASRAAPWRWSAGGRRGVCAAGTGTPRALRARGPALALGFAPVLAVRGAAVVVALARRHAVALLAVLAGAWCC
jgi:hypothetical protein